MATFSSSYAPDSATQAVPGAGGAGGANPAGGSAASGQTADVLQQ